MTMSEQRKREILDCLNTEGVTVAFARYTENEIRVIAAECKLHLPPALVLDVATERLLRAQKRRDTVMTWREEQKTQRAAWAVDTSATAALDARTLTNIRAELRQLIPVKCSSKEKATRRQKRLDAQSKRIQEEKQFVGASSREHWTRITRTRLSTLVNLTGEYAPMEQLVVDKWLRTTVATLDAHLDLFGNTENALASDRQSVSALMRSVKLLWRLELIHEAHSRYKQRTKGSRA